MALRIGDIAPDFEQISTAGWLRFHAWKGANWTVLFSHPHDFTPVCTTELGEASRLAPEFTARGAKLIGLSVDTPERHAAWAEDIAAVSGHRPTFPIIADHDREVAHLYDMIHPNATTTQTVRVTFIIDPNNVVRLIQSYPNAIGRDFAEILRALDALRLTDAEPVVTPANWRKGEPVIAAPHLADAEVLARFGAPLTTDLPYLRRVAQPVVA
ncbi:MAG TPA: peroxiredoxin [Acidiphilium sp.]